LSWGARPSVERLDVQPLSAPTNGISASSPLNDIVRLPLNAAPDSDVPAALGGDIFRSTAVPGSVALLVIVVVGVAFGYRQARQHDAAGVDVMRFIS
jgi:hypothetical protein